MVTHRGRDQMASMMAVGTPPPLSPGVLRVSSHSGVTSCHKLGSSEQHTRATHMVCGSGTRV